MSTATKIGVTVFALLVSSCANGPAKQAQIANYEAPGNLAPSRAIGCQDVSALRSTDTPPDLYRGMVECVRQDNYAYAVYLFALAGTYTYYDALRVSDSSAHQAHSVLLQRSLSSLGKSKRDLLFEELRKTLGNKEKLPGVCAEVSRIGAPHYYPRYMVQHGMNAFFGRKAGDDGLVKNFNSRTAWEKSMIRYLHCPPS